jgi:hypothetical protein
MKNHFIAFFMSPGSSQVSIKLIGIGLLEITIRRLRRLTQIILNSLLRSIWAEKVRKFSGAQKKFDKGADKLENHYWRRFRSRGYQDDRCFCGGSIILIRRLSRLILSADYAD